MNAAFLCLGGNIGDRLANLGETKRQLGLLGCKILNQSSIYQTKAWGVDEAPDYYNQCIQISTNLNAHELMKALLSIEENMGRVRTESRNASRTMDLDILFFNDEQIITPDLEVPHPRLQLRNFVLIPMAEIAPKLMHPKLRKTIQQLLNACIDESEVNRTETNVHLY